MMNWIQTALAPLPERHRNALEWFKRLEGELVEWPKPLKDGTLVATRAKGIYKPEWSVYALSVKQTLGSPYPDAEIMTNSDGSWTYRYFQESLDLEQFDRLATNRGMLECLKDTVPVGVLRQEYPKPRSRYRVIGLALVTGFDDGYFTLEGISSTANMVSDHVLAQPAFENESLQDQVADCFDPGVNEDERRRVIREVRVRQGQALFRKTLLDAYGRRCALTGYDAPEALEAAHIVPYRGSVTNHPSNGLLLRADLHNLFDLGLIGISEADHKLLIASELRGSSYESLKNTSLGLPSEARLQPSSKALRQHRDWAGLSP